MIASMRNPESDTELSKLSNILVCTLDVTKPETIDLTLELAIHRFGKIDAVVNNAGYGIGFIRGSFELQWVDA